MATSRDSPISCAASLKQSYVTPVSIHKPSTRERTHHLWHDCIRFDNQNNLADMILFPLWHYGRNRLPFSSYISSAIRIALSSRHCSPDPPAPQGTFRTSRIVLGYKYISTTIEPQLHNKKNVPSPQFMLLVSRTPLRVSTYPVYLSVQV
jgi:hypothetical protein